MEGALLEAEDPVLYAAAGDGAAAFGEELLQRGVRAPEGSGRLKSQTTWV